MEPNGKNIADSGIFKKFFTKAEEYVKKPLRVKELLNDAYQKLTEQKVRSLPQVVFISVDPERDTPTQINKYVHSFNPNFTGATGSKTEIDKMAENFNVLYMKVANNPSDKNYQIDHSGTVLVINPNGEFAALFSPPLDAQKLADDYKTLVKD